MRRKPPQAIWGGTREGAGRKPLGEKKRVHRSVTIDPDVYEPLKLDVESLQAQKLKAKASDVLNCRLRRDYRRKPDHLISEDLEEANRAKLQALDKPTRRAAK